MEIDDQQKSMRTGARIPGWLCYGSP